MPVEEQLGDVPRLFTPTNTILLKSSQLALMSDREDKYLIGICIESIAQRTRTGLGISLIPAARFQQCAPAGVGGQHRNRHHEITTGLGGGMRIVRQQKFGQPLHIRQRTLRKNTFVIAG